MNVVYSGAYESSGVIAFGVKTGFTSIAPSRALFRLFETGLQTLRTNSLIAGGKGNDSIFLGDQLSTFDGSSIRGGAGNDILVPTTPRFTAGVSQFSGSELKVVVVMTLSLWLYLHRLQTSSCW